MPSHLRATEILAVVSVLEQCTDVLKTLADRLPEQPYDDRQEHLPGIEEEAPF